MQLTVFEEIALSRLVKNEIASIRAMKYEELVTELDMRCNEIFDRYIERLEDILKHLN